MAYDTKQDRGDYLQTLKMLLAVSFWHELTHGFVSFIAGSTLARTPPQNAPAFAKPGPEEADADGIGESGDWIECEVWGGSMQLSGGMPSMKNTVRTLSLLPNPTSRDNGQSICYNLLLTILKDRKALFQRRRGR